jgi:hypothetical protein
MRPAPPAPGSLDGEPSLARSIYGTILALAVVLAVADDPDHGIAYVLGGLLATAVVFWLAHVYAEVLAEHVRSQTTSWWADVRYALTREWPLVRAAGPLAVALLLGVAGLVSRDTAVDLAVGVGLVELFGWGLAVGRKLGQRLPLAVLTGLANCALGAALVALKGLVH